MTSVPASSASPDHAVVRRVFGVLSARSLPYARHAFSSLFERSLETIDLTLITDAADDAVALSAALREMAVPSPHRWRVHAQAEADALAAEQLARHPHVARFRFGHPCWRKITDPLLYAKGDEEMVILDPDLYFPNRFRFERTPQTGVLLMHQVPHCLLPPEVVRRAYASGVHLAHHTDIGVAQLRRDALDLDWLDGMIARLGGEQLPRAMHIESIVWAALALRIGGGYLDPEHWHCWRNAHWKRLARKLGVEGRALLRIERFEHMKCFHGGGVAKWWVPQALEAGQLPAPRPLEGSRPPMSYEELTPEGYEKTQRLKKLARSLGYYRLVGSG